MCGIHRAATARRSLWIGDWARHIEGLPVECREVEMVCRTWTYAISNREGTVEVEDLEGTIRDLACGRIDRREFLKRAVALGLTATAAGSVVAACGGGTSPSPGASSPTPMSTEKPAALHLYNYSEYMSDDLLKAYEKETGIKVVQTYIEGGGEAVLAKLKTGAGGWDVIDIMDYLITIMAKTELLYPLDLNLLPNLDNVEPMLANPTYDPITNGHKWSMPYMFGTTGIGVRTDKVDEDVTGWTAMWNQKYKNQIVMMTDTREVMTVGLLVAGFSPNTTVESEVDAATEKLIDQKPLVRKYDQLSPKTTMLQGNALTQTWDGDVAAAVAASDSGLVKYILPSEGYRIWGDGMIIPTTAPSPYWAHKFLNMLQDPKWAASCSNAVSYQTANAKAAEYITDPVLKEMRPTPEDIKRGTFIQDLGKFEKYYEEAFTKVRSS